MDDIVSFGAWVQQRRKALHLTQAELAEHIGCAVVTIKKIEQDERRPSRQMATLLAEHLFIPSLEREAFLRRARGYSRTVFWVAVAAFGLLLTGAWVAGAGATWACPGIPLCSNELRGQNRLAELQMFHRIAAVTITGLLIWLAVRG